MPSSYCIRYSSRTAIVSHCRAKIPQACERQEECRDAAQGLVDEMDDFLRFGYEELEFELRERKETREIVVKIAKLIAEISSYIIKNNKNMFKTLFRMSANS